MVISLNFPADSIEKMKNMGFEPVSPEQLTWAENHPHSKNAEGVVLRGEEKKLLDGVTFAALVNNFNAWIETDSEDTREKVVAAVTSTDTRGKAVAAVTGTDTDTAKAVKVA